MRTPATGEGGEVRAGPSPLLEPAALPRGAGAGAGLVLDLGSGALEANLAGFPKQVALHRFRLLLPVPSAQLGCMAVRGGGWVGCSECNVLLGSRYWVGAGSFKRRGPSTGEYVSAGMSPHLRARKGLPAALWTPSGLLWLDSGVVSHKPS